MIPARWRERARIIGAITHKDLVDAVKNLNLLFILILPVGMSLLFRVILPTSLQRGMMEIAVYAPAGSRLVAALRSSPQVRLFEAPSARALRARVEREALGGVALPSRFDESVAAGKRPELAVLVNRQRPPIATAAFEHLVTEQVWALAGQPLPVRLLRTEVGKPPAGQPGDTLGSVRDFILIILLLTGLAMTGAYVVPILLVEEKEKHTLEALLLSPAGPVDVMVAKALTGLIYCLLIAGVLLTLNQGWTATWPVTVLGLVLGALFTVSVGLLLGGLVQTTAQLNTWATVVIVLLFLPGSGRLPGLPDSMGAVRLLVPTNYMTRLVQMGLAGDASPSAVWRDAALLAGSVVLVFSAAVRTLRRERA
jgi:ABC-2 type transport system permease protein